MARWVAIVGLALYIGGSAFFAAVDIRISRHGIIIDNTLTDVLAVCDWSIDWPPFCFQVR